MMMRVTPPAQTQKRVPIKLSFSKKKRKNLLGKIATLCLRRELQNREKVGRWGKERWERWP